jgi:hypothetical protein
MATVAIGRRPDDAVAYGAFVGRAIVKEEDAAVVEARGLGAPHVNAAGVAAAAGIGARHGALVLLVRLVDQAGVARIARHIVEAGEEHRLVVAAAAYFAHLVVALVAVGQRVDAGRERRLEGLPGHDVHLLISVVALLALLFLRSCVYLQVVEILGGGERDDRVLGAQPLGIHQAEDARAEVAVLAVDALFEVGRSPPRLLEPRVEVTQVAERVGAGELQQAEAPDAGRHDDRRPDDKGFAYLDR